MSYSKEIAGCITRFLDSDGWKYRLDEEKEVIKCGIALKSKMKHVDILIDLRDDKYLMFFTCPLAVEESERAEMRKLMNLINYGVMFGNFEMDDQDGELRFRYSVDCSGALPSQKIVEHSLYIPALTIDKYGDAIVQVLMGFGTAEEAYKKARGEDK